ncbi:MAG: homoserine O-acetyltransferase [Thermomicrobiales bacterium]|nr:homoserine O-acetyltransferase [Thermomicrobiales bacterium]
MDLIPNADISNGRARGAAYLAVVHGPGDAQPVDDGTLRTLPIGPLDLEMGGRLAHATIAYRTWGRLNDAADNAVLVLHALTGDSNAAGDDGWWSPLIGPDRPIDTNRAFVVCANVLGGCQGSTGPTSIEPASGRTYGLRFPFVTIGDMVNAQRRLIEQLGIRSLVAIGGSIGGFQALEWATRHPDLVSSTVVIAASGRLAAQGIAAHSEIGRQAIMADPEWRRGDYAEHGTAPVAGLAIARMAAMVTYQSRESMEARFGRRSSSRPACMPTFGDPFDVETYLQHHGDTLVKRFDANSYLYLTRAMDLYDLGRNGGDEQWLRRIAAPVLLVGIRSDWLFPAVEIQRLAAQISAAGKEVTYQGVDSPHGHDAFLKEWDQLAAILAPFLQRVIRSHAFAW